MSAPVLVTGAAGFVGQHLIERLALGEAEIVAWHRPRRASPATTRGVRWEPVDVLDRQAVRESLSRLRPRAIYHCAGQAHVGRSWTNTGPTFAVNVRGTHHIVSALEDAGVRARVLIPSSAMVYAPAGEPLTESHRVQPSSPYALSKLAQEMAALGVEEAEPSIARAFNHFGPGQDPSFATAAFARQIAAIEHGMASPDISVGNLDARRDMTDVRDTVRAYQTIVERGAPGRTYNVCSGRAVAVEDLLELLLARARVAIRITRDPSRYRPNDLPIVVGDPWRITSELGWRPEIPIDKTIDDVLAYWRGRVEAGADR